MHSHTRNRGGQCWPRVISAYPNLTFKWMFTAYKRFCVSMIPKVWRGETWFKCVCSMQTICVRQLVRIMEGLCTHLKSRSQEVWCWTSVSYLFSAALCFVVSAGHVTPGSEIWYALAHWDSPALSPVKKKKRITHFNKAPKALSFLRSQCLQVFLKLPLIKTREKTSACSSVWGQLVITTVFCWGQMLQPWWATC